MNIDFDLEDTQGIQKVKTSYAVQICEVEFDEEKLSIQEVIKVIKNTGYKAKVDEQQ